jgi:Putative peptidoglycan binding domain
MTMTYAGAGPEPSTGPTPGIENWKRYMLGRWPGGMDLGTWSVRNIRGGSQLSVHAVGRAWDWRYADPGPGRSSADEAIAFALDHHELLGIQAIHDYVNCSIWRCSRAGGGPGWKLQKPGNGMGEQWAKWLHWEVHPEAPLHTATVEELVADAPAGVHPPEASASLPAPTLQRDANGAGVEHLQRVLAFWNYYRFECDGNFAGETEDAVKCWQRDLQPFNGGPADGVYGPKTHAAAAASYAALNRMRDAA